MILFLDFDGVTHPQPCFQENVFCRLPLIEEVIREFAQVKIVISSSWREHYALDDMQKFFAPDIRPRVISTTPVAEQLIQIGMGTGEIPEWQRQWECEWWIDENMRIALATTGWMAPGVMSASSAIRAAIPSAGKIVTTKIRSSIQAC